MKKILMFFLITIIFSGCEKFNPIKPPEEEREEEKETIVEVNNLMIYSERGWHSDLPELFLQKDQATKLVVSSKSNKEIESATWTIEGKTFQGKEITFTPIVLGEIKAELVVQYLNKDLVKANFTLVSTLSLAEKDPVKAFILKKDGAKADLIFLFSKERISNIARNNLMFIGTVTDWKNQMIPLEDYNYIIKEGIPERVLSGGDYVGVKFSLTSGYFGKVAIIHSGNLWADLSGSRFIKKEEPTVVSFKLETNAVVPALN